MQITSPLSGAVVTIDVRPSQIEEADVAVTIDTLGDKFTLQLTADQAEELRGELRRVIRATR